MNIFRYALKFTIEKEVESSKKPKKTPLLSKGKLQKAALNQYIASGD